MSIVRNKYVKRWSQLFQPRATLCGLEATAGQIGTLADEALRQQNDCFINYKTQQTDA